jgi:hypothetical protein
MNQNYERWRDYSTPQPLTWVVPWIIREIDSAIFVIWLLAVACFAKYSNGLKRVPGGWWIISIAALGIAFILITVPARRFALGYFALAPSLLAPVHRKIVYPLIAIIPLALDSDWRTRRVRFILLIASLAAFTWILFVQSGMLQKLAPVGFFVLVVMLSTKALLTPGILNILAQGKRSSFWIIPPAVEKTQLEIWVEKETNDIKYTHSLRPYPDGRCWAAELPCTPWLMDENIKLRDPKRGLAGGFVRAGTGGKAFDNNQFPPDEKGYSN